MEYNTNKCLKFVHCGHVGNDTQIKQTYFTTSCDKSSSAVDHGVVPEVKQNTLSCFMGNVSDLIVTFPPLLEIINNLEADVDVIYMNRVL